MRKNAFGDFNEIIQIFLQIIFYPPIFLILSAFFNSSHIHLLLLSSFFYPFSKVHIDSINNEARNVSLTPTSQVAIMDDCYTQKGSTSPNQL